MMADDDDREGRRVSLRGIRFGRDEVVFVIAALGLAAQSFVSVVLGRSPDPTLLTINAAILGVPIFLAADRSHDDDDR